MRLGPIWTTTVEPGVTSPRRKLEVGVAVEEILIGVAWSGCLSESDQPTHAMNGPPEGAGSA